MFESICVVGERGQITLPKVIRQINGIKSKDKLVVKMENQKMVVEKLQNKQEIEKSLKEYHSKYAKRDLEICEDWKQIDKETDAMLDDY
ncbi:MAG: AbrB/MazE/SpoVT family DNA-binding domain-containing protein [archaeon]